MLSFIPPSSTILPYIERFQHDFISHGENVIVGGCGLGSFTSAGTWVEWVRWSGYSPTSLFFTFDSAVDAIVGCIDIRPLTAASVEQQSFNIGYSVSPAFRGRGYGTGQLLLGLQHCAMLGMHHVIISADTWNTPSIRVIQKCGGRFLFTTGIKNVYILKVAGE